VHHHRRRPLPHARPRRPPRSVAATDQAALPTLVILNFEQAVEPSTGAAEAVPSYLCEPGVVPNPKQRKRAKTQLNRSSEAKAATTNFLASVRQALQVPLATMPGMGSGNTMVIPATPTTSGLQQSGWLANKALNSTVRTSKKGEVLVMHKMGALQGGWTSIGAGATLPSARTRVRRCASGCSVLRLASRHIPSGQSLIR
jgi:hypothetical protein